MDLRVHFAILPLKTRQNDLIMKLRMEGVQEAWISILRRLDDYIDISLEQDRSLNEAVHGIVKQLVTVVHIAEMTFQYPNNGHD